MKQFGNVVNVFHVLLKSHLKEGMTVIDATAGNGHDSLLLKQVIGPKGFLYVFDIQKAALEATRERLESAFEHVDKVTYIEDSHANLMSYVAAESIDVIVFNLGYYPGGDKAITTQSHSSINALNASIDALKSGGILYVLCYRGHEAGAKEYEALSEWFKSLDQKAVDVMYTEFVNQQKSPPVMWVLEKK